MKRREEPASNSGGRTTKFRRRCLKDSAKQVFESIPQIPINVKEIKKIILKDQFISSDQSIDENELLNVLTANCKGRNALFFKAYGHAKVFGLRSSIPDGSTQILDAGKEEKGNKESLSGKMDDSVLYVQLPDGYPVITDDGQGRDRARRAANTAPAVDPLSLDSEIIILDSDDGGDVEIVPDDSLPDIEIVPVDDPIPVPVPTPVKPKATSSGRPKRETAGKRRKASPAAEEKPPSRTTKAKSSPVAVEKQKPPPKPIVTATITPPPAADAVPSTTRIVPSLVRRSSNTNEIEIPYIPTPSDLPFVKPRNTKEMLTSIPGFNMKKVKLNKSNSSNRKLSCAQMIQQTKEGQLNLESPESILGQVNLRGLLNKGTFSRLPGVYQFKLQQLLPETERLYDEKRGLRLNPSAFNNEFFAKACHEWRERLLKGDFTPEALQKSKNEMDSDRRKLDSWKRKHFEPVWGAKKSYKLFNSFDEYVARGGVSIEEEIKAAKAMHHAKKFKVDDSTTTDIVNDHANTSEDTKPAPEATNEDSKTGNIDDNILVLVKDGNDLDDNKSQDGSVSNDAVTIIDDEENVLTADSSPSNDCYDPLETVPVEVNNAKDSIDDKTTTDIVENDKDVVNNDKSEEKSSEVKCEKSSKAIDEDIEEKSSKVSDNESTKDELDNDKLHEDNINKDLTVIDVNSEKLKVSIERTLNEEIKSTAVDKAETVNNENLAEEKCSLKNNEVELDKDKTEATEPVEDEKVDISIDTSSAIILKETTEEIIDVEKDKSIKNIIIEETSNTSEKIHEEIFESLEDEKKDTTEDKSVDLNQKDENPIENKTKEDDVKTPTVEENTSTDATETKENLEEIKESKTETEKVEHKKEGRRRSDKGDSNGLEVSVPTLTVSVVSEDDQERIKDLKDLLKVQKSSPEKVKNPPTSNPPENPQSSISLENSQDDSKSVQNDSKNSGNVEASESDLEGSKVDDKNDKSDSLLIEETESLPESSHEDNTIEEEINTNDDDVIMSEQPPVTNILSEKDQIGVEESVSYELKTDSSAEISTEHEDSMKVDSEKSLADSNDSTKDNVDAAPIEDSELIEIERTSKQNNMENSEVKHEQETVGENKTVTVDELPNIETEIMDDTVNREDSSNNDKELELISQPEVSDEVSEENMNEDHVSDVEAENALDNSLTEVATDNTNASLDNKVTIDATSNVEPKLADSLDNEIGNISIAVNDSVGQLSNTSNDLSNADKDDGKDEVKYEMKDEEDDNSIDDKFEAVDNPIDVKDTSISTKISNVASDIILSGPEVNSEPKVESITSVSHQMRPASADLALTTPKDPAVSSITYRPASVGVELDKILVKSESVIPSIQINFQESTSTTNKSTNQNLMRFKSLQKTSTITTSNTNTIPAANKLTNKVVLKSLLPKPPPTAKNYTNYVCNTKAFLMCKACGAFCHDECLNQQKLCISCVIK